MSVDVVSLGAANRPEMSDDQPLVEAIEHIETITAPSIKAIRVTSAALKRTVDTANTDCRALLETLRALGNVLRVITQSAGLGQGLGWLGPISLPFSVVMPAVLAGANRCVREQTGSLNGWMEFVASASTQFEAYVAELETVAQLSQQHHTAAESEIDVQQARADEELLLDALNAKLVEAGKRVGEAEEHGPDHEARPCCLSRCRHPCCEVYGKPGPRCSDRIDS